jgi:deazaflavin-dependent oxidoreductase (nitroreductase family)
MRVRSTSMPLPRALARFNIQVTNRVMRPFAGRAPGFAVITHVGRKSGRAYTSPVNLFKDGDGYVIALTYGRDSEWVRNVVAAGHVDVRTEGHTIRLVDPEIVHDETRRLIPPPARWILGALDVDDVMRLRPAPGASSP